MEIYGIRDKRANELTSIFISKNNSTATRSFRAGKDQAPEQFLDDYELVHLACIDMSSGCIIPLDYPEFVVALGSLQ
jgi:hypothetical protein